MKKLQSTLSSLIHQLALPASHYDHPLRGEYSDCRECHIEPDWLLIYFIIGNTITFARTGTHSDLFR